MAPLRPFMILFVIFQVSNVWAIPKQGHQIMMSGPSDYAVEAGKEAALAGGNVVDAAVAMALTLSVTNQYFGSLGGGGFAVVKMKDKPVAALDFREVAPAATSPSYYYKLEKRASRHGGTAVGVPGIPAGLWELHQKYGKLEWTKLFAMAETLATKGFRVAGEWVTETNDEKDDFNAAGKSFFFKKNVEPYLPGEELKQPALAQALGQFKALGPKGFYEGPVAEDIVKAVTESGGAMTLKDLKNYKVRWQTPLEADYNGYHVYLMPPPSSGGIIIKMMLALAERAKLQDKKFLSADELHWLAGIESRAFRGRFLLGDPDFHTNPLKFLMSKSQMDFLYQSIDPMKATTIPPIADAKSVHESDETTHMSVLDKDGNGIAMTITLNGEYGSGVVTPKYGIALNNEMDDFTTKPGIQNMYGLYQGEGNSVQPGKRPLSSMSPTLVEKDGDLVMSLGAPGGPRIISGVFQVLYRVLGRGMDVDTAIQTGRVHHQFMPDTLIMDRNRFSADTLDAMKKRGHKVEDNHGVAKVYAVKKNDQGVLDAAFDSRGEGAAGGY